MNTFKIIFNKNGTSLEIKADAYIIKDNVITFEVSDKYRSYNIQVAVFNMNNIIGFKRL